MTIIIAKSSTFSIAQGKFHWYRTLTLPACLKGIENLHPLAIYRSKLLECKWCTCEILTQRFDWTKSTVSI